MKKTLLIIILVIGLGLNFIKPAFAEEHKEGILQGVDVLTGFGWGKLREKGNYHLYPVFVGLNFDLKKLTEKIGFNPPMLLQFQLEPYIAGVSSPNSNIEVGNAFALKVGLLPDSFAVQPYIKAAAGTLYMSQHTREQSTQFNFYEYGGLGVHWFFTKNTALTVEGRFRHLSNAGIDSPNSGINTYFGLVGLSYQF